MKTASKNHLFSQDYVLSFAVCTLGPPLRLWAPLLSVCEWGWRRWCTSCVDVEVCMGAKWASGGVQIIDWKWEKSHVMMSNTLQFCHCLPNFFVSILVDEDLHGIRVSNAWGMGGKRGSALSLLKPGGALSPPSVDFLPRKATAVIFDALLNLLT